MDLIHQGRGVNAKESVRFGGTFLCCCFHEGAAIGHAFKCLEIDGESGRLCRRKRAALKDSFGVTRTRAHRTEGGSIDLLELRG